MRESDPMVVAGCGFLLVCIVVGGFVGWLLWHVYG